MSNKVLKIPPGLVYKSFLIGGKEGLGGLYSSLES